MIRFPAFFVAVALFLLPFLNGLTFAQGQKPGGERIIMCMILEEFYWMTGERRVIDKLRGMDPMGLREAWVLRKNSRRMGFRIGLVEAAKYLKRFR